MALSRLSGSENFEKTVFNLKSEGFSSEIDTLTLKGYLKCSVSGRHNIGISSVKMLRLTEDYLASPEKFSLTAKQSSLPIYLKKSMIYL